MNHKTAKFSDIIRIDAMNLQKDGYYQDTGQPILKCIVLIFSGFCGISPCYAFLSLAKRKKERMYQSIESGFLAHTDIVWYPISWYLLVFPFVLFLSAHVVFLLVPN